MKIIRYFKLGLVWLVAVLFALPLALTALIARLFSATVLWVTNRFEPSHSTWRELIEYDPDLGWRPIANLDAHYVVKRDDIHRIQTDSEGWPRKDILDESHDVVVIGDSYAYGFGVDTGSSFADLNESPRIKSIGAPGYSMVHGVLLMRQLAPRLAGKLVVWFVYLENDLYDNLFPTIFSYRTPFVRKKNGENKWKIVSEHVSQEKWTGSAHVRPNMDVLAELCTPSPLSDRVYSACEFLVREAKAACDAAGAELVVFAIPNLNQIEDKGRKVLASKLSDASDFDPYYPEARIRDICKQVGLTYVAGSDHLQPTDYKKWERWHWSADGHEKVADLLRSLHRSRGSNNLTPDASREDSMKAA